MIKDAFIIFKKEANNLFRDRRALLTNFLLPIIITPIIIIASGLAQTMSMKATSAQSYTIAIEGQVPSWFVLGDNFKVATADSPSSQVQARISFPTDAGVEKFDLGVALDRTNNAGQYIYSQIENLVNKNNATVTQQKLSAAGISEEDLKPVKITFKSTASDGRDGFNILGLIVPYILIIFLVSGPMGLALQVTAGEKENGSLSSLLVNQVSRNSIALGKIFYIVFVGMMGAILNLAGLLIGIQVQLGLISSMSMTANLPPGPMPSMGLNLDFANIISLLVLLISASTFISSFLVVLGASAKTVKEGTGYIMPFMMVSILLGVATMNIDPSKDLWYYCVPILGTIFNIKLLIANGLLIIPLLLTLGTNIVLAVLGTYLGARVYRSERVFS